MLLETKTKTKTTKHLKAGGPGGELIREKAKSRNN
jgi:hypothetical protein